MATSLREDKSFKNDVNRNHPENLREECFLATFFGSLVWLYFWGKSPNELEPGKN
jgi:hypothetical protein